MLEVDAGSLSEETILADLDTWDSLSVMTFIAFVSDLSGAKIGAREIRDCETVGDLLAIAGLATPAA